MKRFYGAAAWGLVGCLILAAAWSAPAEAKCPRRACSPPSEPKEPIEISWSRTTQFWSEQAEKNPNLVAGVVGSLVALIGVSAVFFHHALKVGRAVDDSFDSPHWHDGSPTDVEA